MSSKKISMTLCSQDPLAISKTVTGHVRYFRPCRIKSFEKTNKKVVR